MKRLLLSVFTLAVLSFTLNSCIKDTGACQPKTVASEDGAMLALAAANNMTAPVKHPSGMYYQIIAQGSGPAPTASSSVKANYLGKLANGNIFDQTTPASGPATFRLGEVIVGWQLGLPLINKGGRIKLVIPSTYGYGCNANGPIPGYSVLYFDIELIDVL